MSLDVEIHGRGNYNIGYGHFALFRRKVVRYIYGYECEKAYMSNRMLTDEEIAMWNSKCDDDLDLFLWHSDCDGKFTVSECRKIKNAMKRNSEKIDALTDDDYTKEKYAEWFTMFAYCARHRVIMRFM